MGAWALMLPGSAACGMESDPNLHRAAEAAKSRLDSTVRERVHLHCGDVLQSGSSGEWRQASVIFVTLSAFSAASSMELLIDGLQSVEAGTRIVTFSIPLCLEPTR